MLEKLQECQDRFEAVNEMLADPATARQPQEYQKLAREVGELREVVEVGARYRELETSIGEAEEIIDEGSDADLARPLRASYGLLAEKWLHARSFDLEGPVRCYM